MSSEANGAAGDYQQRALLQTLLQSIGNNASAQVPNSEPGIAGGFMPVAASEGLSRLYGSGTRSAQATTPGEPGLGFGLGAPSNAALSHQQVAQLTNQQQGNGNAVAELQRLAQLVQAGQVPAAASNSDVASLGQAVQGNNLDTLLELLRSNGGPSAVQAAGTSGTNHIQDLSRLAAVSADSANLPSLLLWAQLLQACGGDARANPLQQALSSHGGMGTGYNSLKRTRDGEQLGVQTMDRDRLEGFRHASLAHLQNGDWPQSLSALAQLSQALTPGMGGDLAANDASGSEIGYAGYSVRRNNAKAGHWTDKEKEQLIGLVQELKPTSAAQWEVVADLMGKWSPKGASAERMYRTLTDPGYYRATNKHGRRLNSRTSIPMYIKAVYALLQLQGHEGNLTQISDVIAKHPEFSRELDWTPRPGAKTYPRWKDALLSCFKEGRYPYLEKTAKKDGGSTVYRLKLDALKVEDVQKYVKYLEIPTHQLGLPGLAA